MFVGDTCPSTVCPSIVTGHGTLRCPLSATSSPLERELLVAVYRRSLYCCVILGVPRQLFGYLAFLT